MKVFIFILQTTHSMSINVNVTHRWASGDCENEILMRIHNLQREQYDFFKQKMGDLSHLFNQKIDLVMATQAEEAAKLVALKAQLIKVNTEIQAKIQALTDAAGNAGSLDPALQAAIDDLSAPVQALDDIVPDVTAPPADGGDGTTTPPTDGTTTV